MYAETCIFVFSISDEADDKEGWLDLLHLEEDKRTVDPLELKSIAGVNHVSFPASTTTSFLSDAFLAHNSCEEIQT